MFLDAPHGVGERQSGNEERDPQSPADAKPYGAENDRYVTEAAVYGVKERRIPVGRFEDEAVVERDRDQRKGDDGGRAVTGRERVRHASIMRAGWRLFNTKGRSGG